MAISGNLTGLKPTQLDALERISARRVPSWQVISPELGSTLAMLSRELGRQIGVFIDRRGQITDVAVGDANRIMLPDFGRVRGGEGRFRGLRFIHTHLRQEPLSRDDMTDLTKLRLDMMVAIGVGPEGVPGAVFVAHLLPPSQSGELHRVIGPINMGTLPDDFLGLIESVEAEFSRQIRGRKVEAKDGRAIIAHVTSSKQGTVAGRRSLDELTELARSAGVEVVDRILQIRPKPDPRYVVGAGKLDDIVVRAMQKDAELLILDCNLSGNQSKAIADKTEMKVIDRTQLILDIFAQRANSADGKLKVELAQLKYLLPRLGAKDDALSRLTGGIGGRGPGETKLEIGRRRARERIAKLQKRIDKLSTGRAQRRQKRQRNEVPVVSIVGYTNAGKSTLLNTLTQSDVYAEDLLFATLETSSRRLRFPREREIIITDTVGFIRDLPRDLVDAFKATLEELEDAHLLLHVVDVSDPMREEQMKAVEKILMDLGLEKIPRLIVLNKADLVDPEVARMEAAALNAVVTSALDKKTLGNLLKKVEAHIWHKAKDNPY
ncbi:MAG: GTPase HflX [Deltaproteobacteria bacterium]|nr:GTPase HflX [Deltaproteobacteria bacterium]MBN2672651.1 GTPase HflX [Deltaproteobacteria bacterium]